MAKAVAFRWYFFKLEYHWVEKVKRLLKLGSGQHNSSVTSETQELLPSCCTNLVHTRDWTTGVQLPELGRGAGNANPTWVLTGLDARLPAFCWSAFSACVRRCLPTVRGWKGLQVAIKRCRLHLVNSKADKQHHTCLIYIHPGTGAQYAECIWVLPFVSCTKQFDTGG